MKPGFKGGRPLATNDYSVQQRLADVNKAIQSILLGGQSYKMGSRSLTRASLDALLAERDNLEAQLASTESSHLLGDTVVAVFEGR